jgi:CYTH domain-containing protein
MKEIERKFIVTDAILEVIQYIQPKTIQQGYICNVDGNTVRVRTKGDKGFLTIKGKTTGISRSEFEYEIPFQDATHLLREFCAKTLHKDRYEIILHEKKWDIDVFKGKLQGLILAEVELLDENEDVKIPSWVDKEVSHDAAYYNANLIQKA